MSLTRVLPEVTAPSLDGLAVTVAKPREIAAADLTGRLREKARALAPRRDRAIGESLAIGDEILIDTVGYVDGRLIPFSGRFGLWRELGSFSALPGLDEGILEAKTGQSLQLQLRLPPDFPIAALRNQPARFLVEVRAARELTMPSLDSPAFLQTLNLGANLASVMEAIRVELQREMTAQLLLQARDQVLDELVARTRAMVPPALVDEEILQSWASTEQAAMSERGFSVEEQKEAQDTWLKDERTRTICERRLQIGLALKAIVEAHRLTPTPQQLEAVLIRHGASFGLSEDEVRRGLKESPHEIPRLVELGWHLFAVDYVMSKTSVTFER